MYKKIAVLMQWTQKNQFMPLYLDMELVLLDYIHIDLVLVWSYYLFMIHL